MLRAPLVTIVAREMRLKFFWSRRSFGVVASATSHEFGTRNEIENFRSRPSFGSVASAARHDIGARNAVENDQGLEMLRVPLVTIVAREMRLKICWSRPWPSFGDVASAVSHEIGPRNAIENDQDLEMLRVSLVMVLAREKRLKFFEVDHALEMLRVPLVTILARKLLLKIFRSRSSFGGVANAAVTILAREMRLKNFKVH